MKRTLVWGIVICVCLFAIVAAISPADDEEETARKNSSYSESVTDDESDVELFPEEVEPVTTKPKVQKKPIHSFTFNKTLYGEKFTKEEARYAVDKVY